jgi:hypothetical protein
MSEEPLFVGTEFDIYAPKPKESVVEETVDTIYNPVASVNHSDLENHSWRNRAHIWTWTLNCS